MEDYPKPRNSFEKLVFTVCDLVEKPIVWFRETVVVPNRPTYNWYHRRFRRVPTIDECDTDDFPCIYEADQQFWRDKKVDSGILSILRDRYDDCYFLEAPNPETKCKPLLEVFQQAELNWFIKYGELGATGNVKEAYMKQKHRLIFERRQAAKNGTPVETE